MEVIVKRRKDLFNVKFQRAINDPLAVHPILVYSKCGYIPPTILSETDEIRRIMGERTKVYFACGIDGENLVVKREIKNTNW